MLFDYVEIFMADILALCTKLRPVVMVDYGGKMPELQEKLCGLLLLCHKVKLQMALSLNNLMGHMKSFLIFAIKSQVTY